MASIRKRHNRWVVRVRRGNNPTKCKGFTKLANAKIWAYQTELALERASAGIVTAPIKLTLIEAKKRYIDTIVSQHEGKDSETYRLDAIINRLEGMRQIDIADKLGISQPEVSRRRAEAASAGLL